MNFLKNLCHTDLLLKDNKNKKNVNNKDSKLVRKWKTKKMSYKKLMIKKNKDVEI